jgi:hypothetical protein
VYSAEQPYPANVLSDCPRRAAPREAQLFSEIPSISLDNLHQYVVYGDTVCLRKEEAIFGTPREGGHCVACIVIKECGCLALAVSLALVIVANGTSAVGNRLLWGSLVFAFQF